MTARSIAGERPDVGWGEDAGTVVERKGPISSRLTCFWRRRLPRRKSREAQTGELPSGDHLGVHYFDTQIYAADLADPLERKSPRPWHPEFFEELWSRNRIF